MRESGHEEKSALPRPAQATVLPRSDYDCASTLWRTWMRANETHSS